MRKTVLLIMLAATSVAADERRFTAADVRNVKVTKGVVIANDHRAITAWRFFGNIREALVSLRSSRVLARHAFGAALFDPRAEARVPPHLSAFIQEAAREHNVDARLIAAVARRESAFNANAVSRTGACGIMQLMPETARYLGVTNVFDTRENIRAGTRYLRTLLDTFDGDLDLALAAYNAGPGAVEKYRGVPPYAETRAYVSSVRAAYERSRQGGG